MPQQLTLREFENAALAWLINDATTLYAIAGTGVPDDSWTSAQLVANELIEGAANAYSRTSIKPGSPVTPAFDATDNRTEVAEQTFVATIAAGQTWTYRWTAGIRNAAAWANRQITAVDATANTISWAANSGTFATGQRVIVTADAGGTLPGGVTALQIYTLQGVTGTTTITTSLRAIGSGTNLDLTSVGSGTLRVRNVPDFSFDVTLEDNDQSASGTLSLPYQYFAKRAQAL